MSDDQDTRDVVDVPEDDAPEQVEPEAGTAAEEPAAPADDFWAEPDAESELPPEPELPAADDEPMLAGAPEPDAMPVPVTSVDEVEPKRSNSGLLVFAGIAIILLIALVGVAFVWGPTLMKSVSGGGSTTSSTSTSKARIETGFKFMEGLFTSDTMAIKSLLTTDAQKAITDAQWADVAAALPTSTATFGTMKWSGDTTAVADVSTQDATATLSVWVTPSSTSTVDVILSAGGTDEAATLNLKLEGTVWHVVSITDATGQETVYDASFVKQLYTDATAQ